MEAKSIWNEQVIQEAVLKELFIEYENTKGGLSGDALVILLQLREEHVFDLLIPTVNKLEKQGFIEVEDFVFKITKTGTNYLVSSDSNLDFTPYSK